MRKIWIICLAAALCLTFLPAQAEVVGQIPVPQGQVADLAGVLAPETIGDIAALSDRMDAAGLGKIYVVTRHFLGGEDANAYAAKLFGDWKLTKKDALLLMVIGEERYALELGQEAKAVLPADSRTSLMANHFRSPYLRCEYDAAVAEVLQSLMEALSGAAGKTVKLDGLFGKAADRAPMPTPAWNSFTKDINSMWQDMFSENFFEEEPAQMKEEANVSWRGVVIWGLVIYFLFFRRKRKFNFGHGPKRRKF